MKRFLPATLARDLPASIVVFLVAMPLCMGIAIASGAPPEKGLLTGIVGGIVVGCIAGSPLQISGPAAGLAVIVFELINKSGLSALGPILMLAGLIQLVAGIARLGQWFRAISPAVVHGMLAGIGVLIVAGQLHVMLDSKPRPHGLANILAAPQAYWGLFPLDGIGGEAPLVVGLLTIAVMIGWEKLRPQRLKLIPGALLGVAAGTAAAAVLDNAFGMHVAHVRVPESLLGSIGLPSLADMSILLSPKTVLSAVAVAFIASAETLLSAAAVDRMHDGPRTRFNRELSAQGVGNMLCGLLGGLPMTGVIVRSSANVQAGAATRASAVMHGVWILCAVALMPWALRAVPMAALAGVLVVTGWRLVSLVHVRHLLTRYGAYPAAIWAVTLITVVATDLLTGVLVGIGLSVLEILPVATKLRLLVRTREIDGVQEVNLVGSATMARFPQLAAALDAVPAGPATIRMRQLRKLDHTCAELISSWMARRKKAGHAVKVEPGSAPRHQVRALDLQHA